MARTIEVTAPSGITDLALSLYNETTDAFAGLIALTERTNTKGLYTGTLAAAPETYNAILATPTSTLGTFFNVVVVGGDPEVVQVADFVNTGFNSDDMVKIGENYRYTNIATGAGYDVVAITPEA